MPLLLLILRLKGHLTVIVLICCQCRGSVFVMASSSPRPDHLPNELLQLLLDQIVTVLAGEVCPARANFPVDLVQEKTLHA